MTQYRQDMKHLNCFVAKQPKIWFQQKSCWRDLEDNLIANSTIFNWLKTISNSLKQTSSRILHNCVEKFYFHVLNYLTDYQNFFERSASNNSTKSRLESLSEYIFFGLSVFGSFKNLLSLLSFLFLQFSDLAVFPLLLIRLRSLCFSGN